MRGTVFLILLLTLGCADKPATTPQIPYEQIESALGLHQPFTVGEHGSYANGGSMSAKITDAKGNDLVISWDSSMGRAKDEPQNLYLGSARCESS